jgi:hypothetical protein
MDEVDDDRRLRQRAQVGRELGPLGSEVEEEDASDDLPGEVVPGSDAGQVVEVGEEHLRWTS